MHIRSMNSRLLLPVILFLMIWIYSCSEGDDPTGGEHTHYELSVIDYFKEIALGMEFGNASEVTRKWDSEMKLFIGGEPVADLFDELEEIKDEINDLATDGFRIEIVDDTAQANYYIYFGGKGNYANIYPAESNLVNTNWGLFYIYWNSANHIYSGHMYVDIERANLIEQKHLLREELTQSLGLAKDSPMYIESIFQSAWTKTNEYAQIDKELIRLLYHPLMTAGLNSIQVDQLLKEIIATDH